MKKTTLINLAFIFFLFSTANAQWTETQLTPATTLPATATFGISADISGDHAIVGAEFDEDHTGVRSGSVYIFEKTGGNWVGTKLEPNNGAPNDYFGCSVAIFENRAVVGARSRDGNGVVDSGAAYVFEKTGGVWSPAGELTASDRAASDNFGCSVDISGDQIIVGADQGNVNSNGGAAYIFELIGGNWSETKITADAGDILHGDKFGHSVSISGDIAVAGAPFKWTEPHNAWRHGAAFVFNKRSGAAGWPQTPTIKYVPGTTAVYSGSRFGNSVSVSGNQIIVGAYAHNFNCVYTYALDGSVPIPEIYGDDPDEYFGYSADVSGNYAVVGARYADIGGQDTGAFYVYQKTGPSDPWSRIDKITPSGLSFRENSGYTVAISRNRVIVGAPYYDSSTGTAYIYEFPEPVPPLGKSKMVSDDISGGDCFGCSVSISGNHFIAGAMWDDTDKGEDSGSAYVFQKIDGEWSQADKLVPDDGAPDDFFGYAVSISGNKAIVGSREDDDRGGGSGSAYVYGKINGTWTRTHKLLPYTGQQGGVFGTAVSISGNQCIVGAPGEDALMGVAYIFEENQAGEWSVPTRIFAGDSAVEDVFGISVSISGNLAIIGARGDDDHGDHSGAAYIFEKTVGWSQTQKLFSDTPSPNNDYFGQAVAIRSDPVQGDLAVVGAHWADTGKGAAYVFGKSGGAWIVPPQKLTADDGGISDYFGSTVAIHDNRIIVGAGLAHPSGAAYIFQNINGEWIQTDKLTAYDGMEHDGFGAAVAISHAHAVVGASGADVYGINSGAVYVFDLLKGDLDNNGLIGLADVIISLKVKAGFKPLELKGSVDVNGDAKIGWAETLYILQAVGGLRTMN